MEPVSFDELIGSKPTLIAWRKAFENIKAGDIVLINGYSGVGKTLGTKLLLKEFKYNSLFLDTSETLDGKDILDRIEKFHNWRNMGNSFAEEAEAVAVAGEKVIVIDELETFLKIDRNVLNHLLVYYNKYKEVSIPIVLIGHCDIMKKLGTMKHHITLTIKVERLLDVDIFLYLKNRLPKRKIGVNDLMTIVEQSRGNIYSAILSVSNKIKDKTVYRPAYYGDEQKTFNEIFECKNPVIIEKLLNDDDWMNPLKVHENIIKLLNGDVYLNFLYKYLYYEVWTSKDPENREIPLIYLTTIIQTALKDEGTDGKIDTMEFSKLLSYISTKKKYKKLIYDKMGPLYPVGDLGMYLIYSQTP